LGAGSSVALVRQVDDLAGEVGGLVGQIAGAHAVVAVGDLQRDPLPELAADQQDRRETIPLLDFPQV
jgi:hypothetical protein